eukprot:4160942-Amphidinium_carterae.1
MHHPYLYPEPIPRRFPASGKSEVGLEDSKCYFPEFCVRCACRCDAKGFSSLFGLAVMEKQQRMWWDMVCKRHQAEGHPPLRAMPIGLTAPCSRSRGQDAAHALHLVWRG